MIGIGDYSFDGQFFARWDGASILGEDRRALHPGAIPAPHRERPRVRAHRNYVLFDNQAPR